MCVCVPAQREREGGGGGDKRIKGARKSKSSQEINLGLLNISLTPPSHCSSDIRAEVLQARLRVAYETSRGHDTCPLPVLQT